MSYPPQSRSRQPDYPDEGFSDREYREARSAERRYPGLNPSGGPPRRGYPEWQESPTGGQGRYSAPPSPARPARQPHQVSRDPGRYTDDDWDDEPVKKRTGLKVLLILLGTVLVVCSGALFLGAWTIHDSYPAKVALADNVGGMTRLTDPELQSGADDIVAALKTDRSVKEAVAGIYAKDGDAQHPVMILAASGLFLRPESELLSGMTEFNTDGFSFDEPLKIEAGPLGGAAKCSIGALQVDEKTNMDFILCGWADYGSVGLAGFFNTKETGAAADLILKIREEVETH